MDGNVTYNGNSLQTYNASTRVGIITNKIKHTDAPNSVGDVSIIANASDSEVPTNEYPNKSIQISGSIQGSTQADLDARIDTFKSYFNKRYKNLDIVYSSGTRRYVVMKPNTIAFDRRNVVLFADFNIELFCKPFGTDIVATNIANSVGVTGASNTYAPTIGGTAPFQLPIITITVTALTGAGDYITISNDANGQQMTLTGLLIAAGNVIVVNGLTRKVTLNGTEVDYSGTFLELEPGPQSFTITDGFTTRTKTILIEYYKRHF